MRHRTYLLGFCVWFKCVKIACLSHQKSQLKKVWISLSWSQKSKIRNRCEHYRASGKDRTKGLRRDRNMQQTPKEREEANSEEYRAAFWPFMMIFSRFWNRYSTNLSRDLFLKLWWVLNSTLAFHCVRRVSTAVQEQRAAPHICPLYSTCRGPPPAVCIINTL